MASVGQLGILILIYAMISMHFVPSIAYAPAPAPRPQLGAVQPAPQPASSARIKSTAGLSATAATAKRVPSTSAVPTSGTTNVPAILTAQPMPVPTPSPTTSAPETTTRAPTTEAPPATTTQAPTTTMAPTTTAAPIVLTAKPLPTPAPTSSVACCATYPENEAEIESIIVAETSARGCSELAGSSYYYEYAGDCLIPLRATCEAVEEEGFEQLGSVGPCGAATTQTADNIIDAEAEAEAEEESPSPPDNYCSECSLQCTALCAAGASAPYVSSCALCASGNGGFCICT